MFRIPARCPAGCIDNISQQDDTDPSDIQLVHIVPRRSLRDATGQSGRQSRWQRLPSWRSQSLTLQDQFSAGIVKQDRLTRMIDETARDIAVERPAAARGINAFSNLHASPSSEALPQETAAAPEIGARSVQRRQRWPPDAQRRIGCCVKPQSFPSRLAAVVGRRTGKTRSLSPRRSSTRADARPGGVRRDRVGALDHDGQHADRRRRTDDLGHSSPGLRSRRGADPRARRSVDPPRSRGARLSAARRDRLRFEAASAGSALRNLRPDLVSQSAIGCSTSSRVFSRHAGRRLATRCAAQRFCAAVLLLVHAAARAIGRSQRPK